MFKKLVVILIAFTILVSSPMTVFAGNPEGSGISEPSAANGTVKNAGQQTNAGKTEAKDQAAQTQKSDDTQAQKGDTPVTEAAAGENEKKEDPQAEIKAAVNEVLKSGSVEDNGQFLMTINNPKDLTKIEKQYSNIYNVSGSTSHNDLIILLAKLNKTTGEYELVELPDGDESIPVLSGYFSVVVDLELGENNFLLISYRASEKLPDKVQYNIFTVEHYKETIPQKIFRPVIEKAIEFKDNVLDLFTGKSK
jgi:hypothetical protein